MYGHPENGYMSGYKPEDDLETVCKHDCLHPFDCNHSCQGNLSPSVVEQMARFVCEDCE